MKITKVSIQNFLGIGSVELDLSKYTGITLIEGVNHDSPSSVSNGSGKSSLIEAVFYGFFGKTKRGYTGDEVVNTFAKKNCHVAIDFEIGECQYRINRYRKDETFGGLFALLDVTSDDVVNLTKGTAKDTQKEVEELIGMSELTFSKILYFGQEDVKSFAGLSDAELKNVFEESLGLTVLSLYESKMKDRANVIASEIAANNENVGRLRMKKEMLKSNVDGIGVSIETFDKSSADGIETFNEFIEATNKELARLDKIERESVESLQTVILNFQEKEPAYKHLLLLEEKLNAALDDAKSIKNVAASNGARLASKISSSKSEIETASEKIGKPCVACSRIVGVEEIEPIVKSIASKIESLNVEYDSESASFAKQDATIESLLKSKDGLLSGLEKMKAMEMQANLAQTQLESIYDVAARTKLKNDLKSFNEKIEELRHRVNPYVAALAATLDELGAVDAKILEANESIGKLDEIFSKVKVLQGAFSNAGIKSRVFDTITPELNRIIQEYLNVLDDISVEISTMKVLKSGDVRDKFEISVMNTHGASSYKGNSGGEKQKIDLCISLAFNALMRRMTKSPLNILLLDEPFEALDVGSAEAAVELCKMVAKDSSVFVITHNQAIKDLVSDRILVEKKEGLATLGEA